MSKHVPPKTAEELRTSTLLLWSGLGGTGWHSLPPAAKRIVEGCQELEHQGMEPGAYTVNMLQYLEVAEDILTVILLQL